MELNKIIFGDNLTILKNFPSDSIDLIYLDPPFFTQTNWEKNGNRFSDKFKDMEEYINFMSLRLKELHRILKPTGSIYLHCDHHASHYLKIEMDKIFNNYQTTIIWKKSTYIFGERGNRIFPENSDYILVYTKGDKYIYNIQDSEDEVSNIWTDISRLTKSKYPTQKPEKLLERIILASSNPGDMVLDPFCGSGTTLVVAKKLGRNYIGIDQSEDSIRLTEERLKNIPNKPTSLYDF